MNSAATSDIALDDLLHAGKRRWGNEHLVVSESFDGILRRVFLHREREGALMLLVEAGSRAELLALIESTATTAP